MKTEQTTPNHIIDEQTSICLRCGLTAEFIRDAAVSPDCEPTTYPMDDPELLLHRAAEWRRRFVAGHGPDYDNDPTYRLIRDLADALSEATRTG